ncbi:phenoloxidase-activating factor 2-like [Drosophila innubila]|uniref:phenoloxidase-activating factor 2-like n=1 Tax=Drosophila innubila TaxID=198719 RepID=UPI00148DC494|nr:phenoloxidase-activating factor 2-like [Drosophila innubila]
MIKLFCSTLCWLLFINADAQNSCPLGSSCVPRWKCNINHGEGILSDRSALSNPCPHDLQMCCWNSSIIEVMSPDANLKCGLRNIKDGNGGDEKLTNFAEFPWVVAIFVSNDTDKMYIGGGSILTPNMVLTAAHIVCSQQTEDLSVRAGEWDTRTESEPYSHQERDVVERICHEHYNKVNFFNDIAVLLLRSELSLNHHIMPICLPRKYEYPNTERCFVAGWGKDKFTDSATSNVLRKVDLPIIDHTTCERQLWKTHLTRYFRLNQSFVCAGGEKEKDTCTGDGGSALFCPLVDHPGQYYQLGIVSWGLDCNYEGVPAAYANVPHLLSWVHTILHALHAKTDYYTPIFNIDYYNREEAFRNKLTLN